MWGESISVLLLLPVGPAAGGQRRTWKPLMSDGIDPPANEADRTLYMHTYMV